MAGTQKKSRLTDSQRAEICAKSATGLSYDDLAKIYGCNKSTICRTIARDATFASKCNEHKKEAEEKALSSMDEWVKAKLVKATNLCEKIMAELSSRDLSEESIRDLAGLFKIIREAFVQKSTNTETEHTGTVKIEFVEVNHADRDK